MFKKRYEHKTLGIENCDNFAKWPVNVLTLCLARVSWAGHWAGHTTGTRVAVARVDWIKRHNIYWRCTFEQLDVSHCQLYLNGNKKLTWYQINDVKSPWCASVHRISKAFGSTHARIHRTFCSVCTRTWWRLTCSGIFPTKMMCCERDQEQSHRLIAKFSYTYMYCHVL